MLEPDLQRLGFANKVTNDLLETRSGSNLCMVGVTQTAASASVKPIWPAATESESTRPWP